MGQSLMKLVRFWKLLSLRKLLYLFHVLTPHDKKIISLLLIILIASGGTAFARIYLKITVPVPEVGKSYIEGALREPRNVNPLFESQDTDRDLSRLIFSGLFTYSGDGNLVPDLAERFEISNDSKIYTVFLREAEWHDGKSITAEDVVFTVKTVQNPHYKSVHRLNWQGVETESIDEHTVRFTLKTPYAHFVENLTLSIIPKHLWEHVGSEQASLHELNIKPVGSGPYKFDTFKQGKDGSFLWYRVKRNRRYHSEGPYLKNITFVFYKTEDELVRALRQGYIHGFGPVSIAKLAELSQKNIAPPHEILMPRIFTLFFNEHKNKILADKKVRKAITLAINKTEIVKLTSGGAVPASGPFPPPPSKEREENTYSFNPDMSKKLLEEAGWKDENEDGIRTKKQKEKGKETVIPLRIALVTSDLPDLIKAADYISKNLREVGFEVDVEFKPFAELESSYIRSRNFEMLLFGQVYGYEPDPFAFWHSSQIKDPGLNIALYANKKVDQLLEEARRTSALDTRNVKYEEAARTIIEDFPAVFLYTQLYFYLLPTDMKGVNIKKIALPRDRFNEISKWYRETKRILK